MTLTVINSKFYFGQKYLTTYNVAAKEAKVTPKTIKNSLVININQQFNRNITYCNASRLLYIYPCMMIFDNEKVLPRGSRVVAPRMN